MSSNELPYFLPNLNEVTTQPRVTTQKVIWSLAQADTEQHAWLAGVPKHNSIPQVFTVAANHVQLLLFPNGIPIGLPK